MKPKQRDIIDCLKDALAEGMLPGTADSDVNVFTIPHPVPYGVIQRAIAEIVYLRSLAGAVTPGPDLVDLRGMLKTPPDKPKTEYPDWMSMK